MLNNFVNYMRNEKSMSENTIYNYASDLTQFKNYIKKDLDRAERKDIENFIAHLKEQGMTASSIHRKVAAIKSFYKFTVKKEYIKDNPALLIESGKLERKLPRPLSEDDINRISNTARSLRDKTIIETLYGAGLRRSELITLKKTSINWEKGVLHIKGKGRKERLVPLNGYALSLLKLYCDSHDSEWVFPSPRGGHLSSRRLNEIIAEDASKARIKGVTPHRFRHSFGTHLYAKGIDSKVLQDLMGHESINTTAIYAKVCVDRNITEYNKYFKREAV